MSQESAFLDRVIATYSSTDEQSYRDDRWLLHVATAAAVTRQLEARPPATILDLACGSGASTAALALQGFEVTGIDCTPTRVDVARRKAKERGAAVQWLCQDMREIAYTEVFDYVLLRDVIFGIFPSEQEDFALLQKMARTLKPNGRCLLEVYNKEFAIPRGVEGLVYDEATNRFVGKTPGPGINSIRLYTHSEWEGMLRVQGLRILRMDGWKYPKDPAPPPWRADIIVAQKASR